MRMHLGLDLGVTNLKWAVVERSGDAWRVVRTGQVADARDAGGHSAVVPQLAEVARDVVAGGLDAGARVLHRDRRPRSVRPRRPAPRRSWSTCRGLVGRPGGRAGDGGLGLPTALINDARAFGLAELRLGAAAAATR